MKNFGRSFFFTFLRKTRAFVNQISILHQNFVVFFIGNKKLYDMLVQICFGRDDRVEKLSTSISTKTNYKIYLELDHKLRNFICK